MKNLLKYIIIILNMFCGNSLLQCSVNPQSGQNLWHLEASIETAVDELLIAQDACCVTTFSALNEILVEQTTISSQLDEIIFNVGACSSTPITISGNGTTISTAGTYCLTADVPLYSSANTITFATNNIIFDLNDHLITGQDSSVSDIVINSGVNNINIANGRVSNTIMMANSSASNITINSIDFFSSGFTCTGCKDITLSDLSFQGGNNQNFLGQGSTHVLLYNSFNGLIKDCTSFDNSGTSFYLFSDGVTTSVGNMVLRNCFAY